MSLELSSEQHQLTPSVIAEPLRKRVPNSGSFSPGQSGNPTGRPRAKHFRRELLRQFNAEIANGIRRGTVVADSAMTLAENGNLDAMELVRDTLDGRPTVAEESGANVGVSVSVEIISASVK